MNLKDLIQKYENQNQKNNVDKEKYKKVKFFKLSNDNDKAVVRFLDSTIDDFDVYEVHTRKINGITVSIKCLGNGCPLCREDKPKLRGYFQLISNGQHFVWDRGIIDIKNIIACAESIGNLSSMEFIITRHGVQGSTSTTYSVLPNMQSYGKPYKLPDKVKILDYWVKDYNEEQMLQIIKGTFSFKASDYRPVLDADGVKRIVSEENNKKGPVGGAVYMDNYNTDHYDYTQNPYGPRSIPSKYKR